jgi:glutathione S-transferase
MELGSAVLVDLWDYETARDETTFLAAAAKLGAKFERLERVLGDGPFFRGASFGLVDAVFGPAFRYFEVFDPIFDPGIFRDLPRVRRWRTELLARPSVAAAVGDDYPDRLRKFLADRGAFLHARSHGGSPSDGRGEC